ncbi:RNase E specificity factor CsrD [Vibrio sp. S17_S38]|uniref:RNase E specificity factor CsrD n=1 Tax=Vibrio sp. S17_S38 TaxID=2720229 RepID=UPI0016802B73|nr:RNase E specificity factor CsrD [Vibrio sp. S17_S38]MBD1574516.1 RNase E specificity factor CsrD [Vibrio sp. S17_S38]
MRYTPTLKISTRLVSFVTIIVLAAMFILFVGGVFTFQKMGNDYIDQNLKRLTQVVDQELSSSQDFDSMRHWLPKLLQTNNVAEFKLTSSAGVIYLFTDTALKQPAQDASLLYQKAIPLDQNTGYVASFKIMPLYTNNNYSFQAFSSLTLAVALVVFCLIQGLKWLKEQLYGSELLEERGRMILAGQVEKFAKGDEREWPYTASEALDRLIDELQDARQERSRFDTFIRTHTFLDQLTGAANRVLFDSKLESALQETGVTGGVLVVSLNDWEDIAEEAGKGQADAFLIEVGQVLSNLIQKYPNSVFSRYYDSQFALMIPHQSEKEISTMAAQCINQLKKLTPPEGGDINNWCHIGLSAFSQGERRGRIIDEAETALKTARLDELNGWARYKKKMSTSLEYRGGVRWRNLFDVALTYEGIIIFQQPCYLINESRQDIEHYELFTRIRDESGAVVKASRFLTAIEQVGYEKKLDQTSINVIFTHLKESDTSTNYSINLFVEPFKKRAYTNWLRYELLQLPKNVRHRLSFEFVEGSLVNNLDCMRPVVKMLAGLGCKVIVNQVGRTIVSTHYTKDLPITYLKLHRSLIKQIHLRSENQLFIRSLLGSCVDNDIKILAVGVEDEKEWKVLDSLGLSGAQGRFFEPESQLLPLELSSLELTKNETLTKSIKPGRRNRWR